MSKRAILIVLDSVGIGALPDAPAYGDCGAHTLAHVWQACGGLKLPYLLGLGLGNIPGSGLPAADAPRGAYGRCQERAQGKDTTTGHWEICGLALDTPFPTYPGGFPPTVIEAFEQAAGVTGVLGNRAASGTQIIEELGQEQLRTGLPIVYTSADSVFQIAAHEEQTGLETLYRWCEAARAVMQGPHAVGRIIARPFLGEGPGSFRRTANRRDYSLPPTGATLLDRLAAAGIPVYGVGKIHDIFCGRGIGKSVHTADNREGIVATLAAMAEQDGGLIFTNLVDFDMKYGHRNDAAGYGRALEEADAGIGAILAGMGREDLLLVCADHGCDTTHPGTDHTREYVPLLLAGAGVTPGGLGTRSTYADIGATAARWLGVRPVAGTSCL